MEGFCMKKDNKGSIDFLWEKGIRFPYFNSVAHACLASNLLVLQYGL